MIPELLSILRPVFPVSSEQALTNAKADAFIAGLRRTQGNDPVSFAPVDPDGADLDARITAANERGCIRTQFAKRVTG